MEEEIKGLTESKQKEETILKLYIKGATQAEIASKLKMCRKTIAKVTNAQLDREILENKKICINCGEEKELTNFKWIPDTKRVNGKWYYRECLKCKYVQIKEKASYEANKIRFFKLKLEKVKRHAKEQNLKYNLTPEYCIEVYERQQGKCFYTDVPLTMLIDFTSSSVRRTDHISFDRIYPHKGYVQGNIVFCQIRINTIKSNSTVEEMRDWMPGWYKRIKECDWITQEK